MTRSEAVVWWPGAAEALVVICALAMLYAGRDVRADANVSDDDVDATSAESRAANIRASGALDRAEKDESQGDYVECARELAPIMWRLSMVSDGDLTEAVEITFNRCNDELAAEYAGIAPRDCGLNIRDAIATIAAPAALVPRAARGACLALVPGTARTQPADDFGVVCPRIALVWSAGGLHRRELAFDGGPLDDTSWCCKLESIAAGTLDGKTLVRVSGVGHPCGGGTAYEATDALYEWNGKSLASPLDISIGFH